MRSYISKEQCHSRGREARSWPDRDLFRTFHRVLEGQIGVLGIALRLALVLVSCREERQREDHKPC